LGYFTRYLEQLTPDRHKGSPTISSCQLHPPRYGCYCPVRKRFIRNCW